MSATRTFSGTVLVLLACIAALSWIGCSSGEVLARAEKIDSRGFPYSVTAKKLADRYRVELLFNRGYPVSSYEFYAGSDPTISATIAWPRLEDFTVVFGRGMSVHCSWDEHKAIWEQK